MSTKTRSRRGIRGSLRGSQREFSGSLREQGFPKAVGNTGPAPQGGGSGVGGGGGLGGARASPTFLANYRYSPLRY